MSRLDFEQFRVAAEEAAAAPAVGGAAVEKPVFAEGFGEARAELPEGYEYLKEGKQVIFGDDVGEVVFYFGPHGARLTRGEGDKSGAVFFRLEGVPMPEEGEHTISRPDPDKGMFGVKVETSTSEIPPEGVPLYDGWGVNIHEGKGDGPTTVGFRELHTESPPYRVVDVTPPRTIMLGGKEISFTDYYSSGGGAVRIEENMIVIKSGYGEKIAVPAGAMVRPASAESYGEARPAGAGASSGDAGEGGAEAEAEVTTGTETIAPIPVVVEAVTEEPAAKENVRLEGRGITAEIKPGYPDGTVISIGPHKARITWGSDGRVYFRFEDFQFPSATPGVLQGIHGIAIPSLGHSVDGVKSLSGLWLEDVVPQKEMPKRMVEVLWDPVDRTTKVKLPLLDPWGNQQGGNIAEIVADSKTVLVKTSHDRSLSLEVPAGALVSSYVQPEGQPEVVPGPVFEEGVEEVGEIVIPTERVAVTDRTEELGEAVAREEERRRVEEKKAWQEAAGEMAGDTFAIIGFENSGKNEIVAAAAFEFRTEIADGMMNKEAFTAMMKELNGIAKSYETQLGRPQEQKLPWPQVADDMGRSNIAGTAFETTGSRIVAAAGYRFRQGISKIQDEGASFRAMMREINGAVGKYREKTGKL